MDTENNAPDDIRGLLEGALQGTVTAETPPAADLGQQPAAEPAQAAEQSPPADRGDGRDDKGRFAPTKPVEEKPRNTLTLKPKAPEPAKAAQPTTETPLKPGEQPKAADVPPPIQWKGAAKVDWNRLPPGVKDEIRQTFDAMQVERQEIAPLKEMIDANRQFLVNEAGSVAEGFRQLVTFAQAANTVDGTVRLVHHLLQRRGLDPRAVFGGQPAQQGGNLQQTPDLASFVTQTVQRALQPYQAQVEHREQQVLQSQVEAFAADPKHPYFQDVRQYMGTLMKAGLAKDMEDAYGQAVRAHPVIWPQIEAVKAEEAAKARTGEVARAQAAQRASLTGAPLQGAILAPGASDGSIRGDLMAAMKAQTGAV